MIRKSISATSKYFKYDIICQFVKMKKIDLINDVFFFINNFFWLYLICESDLNSDFGKANNANIYLLCYSSIGLPYLASHYLFFNYKKYILNFLCMVLNKFINNTFLKKFSIMKYKNNIVVIMFLKYFKIFIWMHFLNKKSFERQLPHWMLRHRLHHIVSL